ncbi:hypothetical protein G9A89_023215 [Geosiphon pyriformis]|nr:hypothetical protein G9A89_023215 [Geosiphon pyriformis]
MAWDQTASDDDFGTCGNCKNPRTYFYWCSNCEYLRYQEAFPKWTSGNKIIDKVIREIQRDAPSIYSFIEWIPYNRFSEIKQIGQGAFSTVYTATWKEGPRDGPPFFDGSKSQKSLPMWERRCGLRTVLRTHRNSQNIQADFFNELKALLRCAPDGQDFENFSLRNVLRCYGITQNPATKEYAMIMQYADQGDLNVYLSRNKGDNKFSPGEVKSLKQIAIGLSVIHAAGLIHRNIHAGNILQSGKNFYIGDVGLSKPVEIEHSPAKGVYGVMPYVAPEVLLGGAYTQAADIYSFGMVIWEYLMKERPFIDRAHDPHLHIGIYNGLRPYIGSHIPLHLKELIERCWDSDPWRRPTADLLEGLLSARTKIGSEDNIQIPRHLSLEVDPVASKMTNGFCKKPQRYHPEAVYKTRFLRFIDPINSTSFGGKSRKFCALV